MLYALPGFEIMAVSALSVPLTGTTSETVLATVSLPPIGANGMVGIYMLFTATVNNANVKTGRARLTNISGTVIGQASLASFRTANREILLANRNSVSSQATFAGGTGTTLGGTTVAITTASVDTSAGLDIVFTGQLASASDTMELETYLVSILRR